MKAYSLYASAKNLKLIVNRVYDEKESREVTAKLRSTSEHFLKMPLECLGYIYEDRSLMQAVRRQIPFLVLYPETAASKCVVAIADNLLSGSQVRVKKGWKAFLKHFFDFSK